MAQSATRRTPELPRLTPAVTHVDGGMSIAERRRRRDQAAAKQGSFLPTVVMGACAIAITAVAGSLVFSTLREHSCQNRFQPGASLNR